MSTFGTSSGKGEALSTTSAATLAATLSGSVAAGEMLVACAAFDGYTGTDPTFSDSSGANTWATAFTRKGTSNATVGIAVGWTVVTSALTTSNTVTVSFSGVSIAAKVMQLWQVDLSLAGEVVRHIAATHAIGTTTAVTTGTESNTDRLSGDMLVGGGAFETNAGMSDFAVGSEGTWVNLTTTGNTAQYKTGSGGAAANVSSVFVRKVTSGTAAQSLTQTLGSALDWSVGFARFRISALAVTQAAYRFYGSGTESGSTASAAQDTAVTTTVTNSSTGLQLRVRLQNSAVPVPATTDFELQYAKNGGAWTAVGSGGVLVGDNGLTDAAVTTNRLGAGSGSFVAGRVTTFDSIAENVAITASNFTEVVYGLTFDRTNLANGDVLTFRVLLDGAPLTTYSVTPTVNVVKVTPTVTEAAYQFFADGTEAGSVALAAQDTAPTVDVISGDQNVLLRIREQLTNAAQIDADTGWQLQYEKNASGTWTAVTTSSSDVRAFASANLTDQGATTRRLTVGTGTFFAGKVSEDGLADNQFLQSGLYTELLYALTIRSADLADADTLRFRVVPSFLTTMTRGSVPTLTVAKVAGTPQSGSDTGTGADTASVEIVTDAVGSETATGTDDAASMVALTTATETGTGVDDASQAVLLAPVTEAAYRWYADGTESGSTPLAAQDTDPDYDSTSGDRTVQLRVRLQAGATAVDPADWRLEYAQNAGAWTRVGAGAGGAHTLWASYDESHYGNEEILYSTATNITAGIGQAFLGNGQALSKAAFYLRKFGTPVGNIVARLWTHTGTYADPGSGPLPGTLLATSTAIAASSVPNTAPSTQTWVEFTFDGSVAMANGVPYFITIEHLTTPGSSSNCISVGYDNTTTGSYGTHALYADFNPLDTLVWVGSSFLPLMFRVYTQEPGAVAISGSASVTEGQATTNRLTGGTGSFEAGKVAEDGTADALGITTNNFTELVYVTTLNQSAVTDGDDIDFRVTRGGSTSQITQTKPPKVHVRDAKAGTETAAGTDDALAEVWTDDRALQSGAARNLESGVQRVFESAPPPVDQTGTDSALGTDTATLLQELSTSDTAAGVDDTAVAVSQVGAETAAGTEDALSINTLATQAETGSSSDDATTTATQSDAESGTGSDNASAGVDQQGAETAAGTDDLQWSSVAAANAETGTGSDDATLSLLLSDSDTGAGTDDASVDVGTLQQSGSETGSGTDDATLTVTLDVAETAAGTDTGAATNIVTGPPGFTPDDLTGLGGWFDASQLGLADGASVTSWSDLSGVAHHLTPVAGTAPTLQTNELNGLPVVRFNGTSDALTATATGTFQHFFVVAKYNGATFSSYNGLLSGINGGEIFLVGDQGLARWYVVPATYYSNGVADIYWSGPMGAFAQMGIAMTSSYPGTTLQVGLDRVFAPRYWDGDVAEVIAYDHVLSDAERIQVQDYLQAKWFGGGAGGPIEDTAVGIDSASVTADTEVFGTDAGNGVDDASIVISVVPQGDDETGVGTDAASITGVTADAFDFATSVDDAVLSSVAVAPTTEAGAGADAAFLVESRADVVESGAGLDDAALTQVILSDTDSGSGSDNVTVDTGGLDGFEFGVGAEDAAVQAAASDAEAAAGSDSALVTADQTNAESATGSDAGSISVEALDSDSGSGLDALTTTSTDAVDLDSATAVDDAFLALIGTLGAETATSVDDAQASELGQSPEVTETALGTDLASMVDTGEDQYSGDPLHPPRKPPRRIEHRPRRDRREDELELIMLGVL